MAYSLWSLSDSLQNSVDKVSWFIIAYVSPLEALDKYIGVFPKCLPPTLALWNV